MCENHLPNQHTKNKKEQPKNAHDQEHATWNRRSFIQALGLAGAGSMALGGTNVSATAASPLSVALSQSENDNILVIIRLKGGNDGLNTIVPIYDYATYANLRPTIKHEQSDLLNLNDDFALPNYMGQLESVWGDGNMKVIHGVGYPEQNLSHFRSSEIWASTDAINFEPTGWWGRYFENLYPDFLISPPEVPPAVQIGSLGNLIFEGTDNNYAFSVANPDQLANVAENGTIHDVLNIPDCVYGDKLLFMRATANTTFTYAGVINDAYTASTNVAPYTEGPLSDQLAIVARMIKGGLGTKVYMVSLGSFDTHANQVENHRVLLEDMAAAIKNFYIDLADAGYDDKVLGMTISEFGRRPYENGSNGTDHGKAAPTLFFGSGLNGSAFVGDHPTLEDPDGRGNLEYTMDFRDLYATVLAEWLCVDVPLVEQHLLDHPYAPVNLGFNCSGTDFPDIAYSDGDVTPPTPIDPDGSDPSDNPFDPNLLNAVVHKPYYPTDSTPHIYLEMPFTAHVDIQLYNILGQNVGTVYNEMMMEGSTEINIRERLSRHLSTGKYIYRISVQNQKMSKSVMVA